VSVFPKMLAAVGFFPRLKQILASGRGSPGKRCNRGLTRPPFFPKGSPLTSPTFTFLIFTSVKQPPSTCTTVSDLFALTPFSVLLFPLAFPFCLFPLITPAGMEFLPRPFLAQKLKVPLICRNLSVTLSEKSARTFQRFETRITIPLYDGERVAPLVKYFSFF